MIVKVVSDCLRCMLRTTAITGSIDDDSSTVTSLHLHSFISASVKEGESHTITVTSTSMVRVVQHHNHRALPVAYYLRGLQNADVNDGAYGNNNIVPTAPNSNVNDAAYLLNEENDGDLFTAGTIISLLLCALIVVLFFCLCYCAYWFTYGGSAFDDDCDEINEVTMTKEERIKYLEQVLICRKYVSPSSLDVPANISDDPNNAEILHPDVEENPCLTCGDIENTCPPQPHLIQHISPQCAICLEHFIDGDMVVDSSSINDECKHQFHQGCIHQWCMEQSNCPCCRRELLFISDVDDETTEPSGSFRANNTS